MKPTSSVQETAEMGGWGGACSLLSHRSGVQSTPCLTHHLLLGFTEVQKTPPKAELGPPDAEPLPSGGGGGSPSLVS